jgi:hypothetical protein
MSWAMGWKMRLGIGMILFSILAIPQGASAQSLAQDIEQLVLDYEKLGQLKQLLTDMKTANAELSKGYEAIKGIAKGNFDLHSAYLNGLLAVSPVVRDYAKVLTIIDNEAALVKECQSVRANLGAGGRWSVGELDYFSSLCSILLSSSLRNLDELTMVLTAGELRMSDAERLGAIDRIDREMASRLSFLRVFDAEAGIMMGQRGLDVNDAGVMRGLQGLK